MLLCGGMPKTERAAPAVSRLKYETYYSYYTPDSTQKGMDKKIGF